MAVKSIRQGGWRTGFLPAAGVGGAERTEVVWGGEHRKPLDLSSMNERWSGGPPVHVLQRAADEMKTRGAGTGKRGRQIAGGRMEGGYSQDEGGDRRQDGKRRMGC
ncbi:unnamed protein product [Pleuronectes platessa]|uniref:Uncharacterized protein n=1 Tax=Pleuronectes platessa TaxID=8262 RepID=A0A9N7VGS3_PLEPL|nr:unnamed protein product [Pleuronectes platessa]